jgi:hypothetical protein
MRVVHSLVCSTIALFAACDDSAADHTSLRAGPVSSTCGAWRCGFNAAEVNGRSLQSLHLQGQPNEDGVRIMGFVPPPLGLLGGYTLTVENDEFVAKGALGGKLRGAQLIGGIILIQLPLGIPLPVTILGYEEVPSWAEGAPPIAAYTLVSVDVNSLLGWKNVCSGSLLDPLTAAVTVLGNETYDNDHQDGPAEPRQLVHARVRRLGRREDEADGLRPADQVRRRHQAEHRRPAPGDPQDDHRRLLRDSATRTPRTAPRSCGTTRPARSTARTGTAPGDVEAVWTSDGALCLDATRLADAEVDCYLPSCDEFDVNDGEWITRVAVDP